MEQQQKEALMQTMHRLKKYKPWPPVVSDISRGEFYMLHKIFHLVHAAGNDKPGVKISVISTEMLMSRPAASQMLNSLEDKGLIERIITKSDRRVVYVNLTERGEKVLKEAFMEMNVVMDKVIEKLGTEDTTVLTKLLDKLCNILEEINNSEK